MYVEGSILNMLKRGGMILASSVSNLLSYVGLSVMGQVKWGDKIKSNAEGIYIVAMTDDPNRISSLETAPISLEEVDKWLGRVNVLELDGVRPYSIDLARRLSAFWLRDETILYIGKAGRKEGSKNSIKARVNSYYRTPLGDKRPHAGGHWIKTLSNLNDLSIYWSECSNPELIEEELINQFIKGVSDSVRRDLYDPTWPFPFANMKDGRGNRKNHGVGRSVIR
jgi:hypothetical protein